MKAEDAKSIVDLIRNSTFGELFITSLIILPIYLGAWVVVLKQVEEELWGQGVSILAILIIIYVFALVVMRFYQSKDDKILNASRRIRAYILSRGWTRMSFERIIHNIDRSFTVAFLEEVITTFPEDFRKGTIKGNRPGMVILAEEEMD